MFHLFCDECYCLGLYSLQHLELHAKVALPELVASSDAVHELASDLGRNLYVCLGLEHVEQGVLLLGCQVGLVSVGSCQRSRLDICGEEAHL